MRDRPQPANEEASEDSLRSATPLRACQRSRRALRRALSSSTAVLLVSCTLAGSIRKQFSAPPAPPPPVEVQLDLYREIARRPASLPAPAVNSAAAAAAVVSSDGPLLEHLRSIDQRYKGRRLPLLRWTARVRRIEPAADLGEADTGEALNVPYWSVEVSSSDVRGSLAYYQCNLRVGLDAAPLRIGTPSELCSWQKRY